MFGTYRHKDNWKAAALAVLFLSAVPTQAQVGVAHLLPHATAIRDLFRSEIVPFHVELGKLHANRVGLDVLVEWKTLSEVGNRGFEVQRASSESRGWKPAGYVPGGANGNLMREYSFLDRKAPPEELRYMLRITGDDGMIQYSQIVSVPVSGTLRAFVVNTPDEDERLLPSVTVDLLKDEVISLQVADHRGNILENIVRKQPLSSGKHEFALDCSRLPGGKYQVLLITSEGRYYRQYDHKR
jgi:hypothetical protein